MPAEIRLIISNKGSQPVRYVLHGSQELKDHTWYAFEDEVEDVPAFTDRTVILTARPADDYWDYWFRLQFEQIVDGYTQIGNSFVKDGGGTTIAVTGGDSGAVNSGSVTVLYSNAVESPQVTPVGLKTIWEQPVDSDDVDLKTNVYREGVDKIVAAIQQSSKNEAGSGDGGGGTGGDGASGSARETLAAAGEAARTEAVTATADMEAQGETAKDDALGALNSMGDAPVSKGYSVSSSDVPESALRVTFPAKFGGATFDFNPFDADRFGTICDWFREATRWTVLVMLAVYCWEAMGDYCRGFSMARQAQGNTIAAGTGGQVTALLAAGLISVAVVGAITALIGWGFDELSFPALRSALLSNPLSGIPTQVFGMVNALFPVATIITCYVAKAAWNMYSSAVFLGCVTVVRFIVP